MSDRLGQIRALLADAPDDAFLLYALATELTRGGNAEAGIATFERLRARHPDYIGLYYHLGTALATAGRKFDADAVYADGIERARRLGDRHALSELMNVRMNLEVD